MALPANPESKRLRMLVPRVYGLGDLSQILDDRAYKQAKVLTCASYSRAHSNIRLTKSPLIPHPTFTTQRKTTLNVSIHILHAGPTRFFAESLKVVPDDVLGRHRKVFRDYYGRA